MSYTRRMVAPRPPPRPTARPLAYEECKRRAAKIEGLVDDECREYYEAGEWLKDIYFARGDWAIGTPPGFSCEE